MGQLGSITCPQRSPDPNPLDFLWGYLKQKVYSRDSQYNIDILKEKKKEIGHINQNTYSSFNL